MSASYLEQGRVGEPADAEHYDLLKDKHGHEGVPLNGRDKGCVTEQGPRSISQAIFDPTWRRSSFGESAELARADASRLRKLVCVAILTEQTRRSTQRRCVHLRLSHCP